ncbi:hypothetical protein AsFPU3_2080 [Aphanothece sacrum FPU3]|nr:hypothetical protein AsFPU3_2080 [Aphanothece sacrum FPU3]
MKTQPKPEFYQSFSQSEVQDIIQGLLEYKEIPFKYFYKDQMTTVWDQSVKNAQLAANSTTQSDMAFLDNNFNIIEQKKSEFERVNVIDIGPGNSYPVKHFLNRLDKLDWLNCYAAIDLSQDMLNLSQKNINSWFPQVEFKRYILDFERQNFQKIALENKTNSAGLKIINILLYLGETIGNHRDRLNVLNNFQKSLGNEDILMLSYSLRLPNLFPHFDYQKHISHNAYKYLIDLLRINPHDCEFIGGFNEDNYNYFSSIVFHENYLIEFDLQKEIKPVCLNKGDEIEIYRHFKYPLGDNFEVTSFLQEMEQASLQVNLCNIDILNLRALAICQKK